MYGRIIINWLFAAALLGSTFGHIIIKPLPQPAGRLIIVKP